MNRASLFSSLILLPALWVVCFLNLNSDTSAQTVNPQWRIDSIKLEKLESRFEKELDAKNYVNAYAVIDSMMVIASKSSNHKEIGDARFNYALIEKNKGNRAALIDNLKASIVSYRRANAFKQAGKAYFLIGQAYIELRDEKTALDYFKESLLMRERAYDTAGIANSLMNVATLEYKSGEYTLASEYYFKALTYAEILKNDKLKAACLSNLSHLSNKMNNYGQSLEYLYEALDLQRKLGNRLGESNVLTNFGNTYIEMKNYDKAKDYYTMALEIKNEIKDEKGIAGVYSNLGIIARNEGDTSLARKNSTTALSIARKIKDKETEANAMSNLALISSNSNSESAELQLLNSLEKAKEVGNPILISANYKNLKEFYEKKGNAAKALKYSTLHQSVNDSLFSTNNADKILELQTKYETAEKEKQLVLLNKEKLEQELSLQKANQYKSTLIFISVFLVFLVAVLYSRYLLKKRSQQQLAAINAKLNELNTTKDKLFSIISHDLKNSVSAFTNITDALSTRFDSMSATDLKYYIGEMSGSANSMKALFRNLLEWAKSQQNRITVTPVQINVSQLLAECKSQVQQQLNRKNIVMLMHCDENLMAISDRDIVTTVLRNLLTNAAKYSYEGSKIEVRASQNLNNIEIVVTDYGIGMLPSEAELLMDSQAGVISKPDVEGEQGAGLGLRLCKELLSRISGKLLVKSSPGCGSTFTIQMPVKN